MAEAAPVVVPVVRPNLTCRFYEERFPQLHEAVNTNVTSIGDMGAYVKLLEYNNVDGKKSTGISNATYTIRCHQETSPYRDSQLLDQYRWRMFLSGI